MLRVESPFSPGRIGRVWGSLPRRKRGRGGCARLNRRLSVAVDSISRYANTHTDRTLVGGRRFRQLDIDHARVRPSQGMHGMLFHLVRVYPSGGSVSLFGRSQIITWHSGRGVSSSNLSSAGFDKVLQQQDRRTLGRLTPLEARRNNAECLPLKGRPDVAF
jgi:hypothetical protein